MGKPKKKLKYNKKGTYPTYEFPPMAFGGWLDQLPQQYGNGGDLPPMEVDSGLPKYGKKRVLNLKDYTKQNTTSNILPVVQNPFSRENKVNLHFPENHGEEHRRLEVNPYFGGVNVEPDVNVYYGGVNADLNLLNKNNNKLDLRGKLGTDVVTYPGGSHVGVHPSVGLSYSRKFAEGGWLDEYSDGGSLTGPGKLLNRSRKEINKQRELEENLRKEGFNEEGVFTRVLPEYTVKSTEKKLYDEAYNKSIAQQQAFQNSWYPGSTDSDNLGYAPGVMDNIKQRATVKANDFVAKNLVNNNKIGDLKNYQKDYIATSNYSGKLRPNIGKQFTEGVQDLGRITQGKLPTSKSLGILSPLEYPVNLVRGTVKGEGVDALKGNISSPWLDANDVDPGAVNEVGVYNTMTDLALDPLNFSGAGVSLGKSGVKYLNKALKTSKESGVLSNTYKLNPWAFKPNPEAYYRTLGNEGFEDAMQSKVIRPKQYHNKYSPELGKRINVNEPEFPEGSYFNKSGLYSTNKQYNPEYITEVVGQDALFEYPKRIVFNENIRVAPNNIPIEKANFYKKDWLRGYKKVPTNLPNKSNFTDGTSFIKDDITNIVKDINPLNWLKENKRKELKKGTKWLDDWYNDPITINKIEGFKANRNSNKIKSNNLNDIANDIHYKTSPEHIYSNSIYPYKKWENNDIKRLRTPEKFNFSIKSEGQSNWDIMNDYNKIIPGDITVNHLTPPSRLKSLQIHEGTHQITHNGGFFDKEQRNILQAPFKKNETELIPHMTDKFDRSYYANPTEVHARMNEIREYLKVKPGEEVTLDMLNKAKNSKKWKGMFEHIQSLPKLKEAFKEIPALIPVGIGTGVGAGILQQKKNGGWLDNL